MKETEDRRARNRPFSRSKIFIAFWKLRWYEIYRYLCEIWKYYCKKVILEVRYV